jgi:hypothetical protein
MSDVASEVVMYVSLTELKYVPVLHEGDGVCES